MGLLIEIFWRSECCSKEEGKIKGGLPLEAEFNVEKQLFTKTEELTIVDFLLSVGKCGFPLPTA